MSTDNSTNKNSQNSLPFISRKRVRPPIGSSRTSQSAWRKEQILRYTSLGYSQTAISEMLGCSQACVSQNLSALFKAAQNNIKQYVEERLPFEFDKTKILYEEIKSRAIDIANSTEHDRDKISALGLAKECGQALYDLNTDKRNLKRAMKAAAGIKEKVEQLEEKREQELLQGEEKEEGPQFYRLDHHHHE